MLKYPVFINAQHEDGRREQSNLMVIAPNPDEALNQAIAQFLPCFGGEQGWTIAGVVDELMATNPKDDVKST